MNAPSLSLADARILVATPLWPRIRAFLWDFASLCDPARLTAALALPEAVPPSSESAAVRAVADSPSPESAAVRAVADSPSPESAAVRAVAGHTWPASPRLARAAAQALGVSPFFHSFPSADASRLLLLSREDYDRLAQFLGTIALAPALRRITAGAEVRALKAAIPDYRETLSFAAYFHKHEPLFKQVASEEGSQVPKFESSNVPAPEPANLRTCEPANILATGHSILATALSTLPPELLLRQRLRFPAGSPADSALASLAGSQVHKFTSSKVPDSEPSNLRTFEPSNGEAAAALAAARLALKLSNPTEYSTLCS